MELQVTALAAACLAIMMLPLALMVSMRRIKLDNLSFGDGDDETLRRQIRAHGNFVEYVPLTLVVLGLAEMQGAAGWLLICAAGLLIGGRILHAFGVLSTKQPPAPRAVGMLMTHASYLLPALWILIA